MQKDYNEESVKDRKDNQESDYAYKNVMRGKENSRTLSVVSLLLSLISIVCAWFVPIVGLITGGGAIVTAIISRKNIGYFDRLSLVGMFAAIFSIVFSVSVIILRSVIQNLLG